MRAQLVAAMERGYVAAFRWLGNRDESRDACQEAAKRALAAHERYDPTRPFYPWFYRILQNHCFDRLARRRRHDDQPPEQMGEAVAEQAMLGSERQRAVARAIAQLDDELRQVIELRHFQDASYEEIAAIVDCPLGTVMSRLYRARKALRKKLVADPGFAGHRPQPGASQ